MSALPRPARSGTVQDVVKEMSTGGSESDPPDDSAEPNLGHLPSSPDSLPFDDMPDLTDRRRMLLRALFGVDVEDPDPVFDQ